METIAIEKSARVNNSHKDLYKKSDNQAISSKPLENSNNDEERWRSSTKDAFPVPKLEKVQNIGRRRELVTKMISERVLKELEAPEVVVEEDGVKLSEYIEEYCDPKFVPFLDKIHVDEDKLTKYPLYLCNNYTFYKALVERGNFKLRSEISNLNEPFRKNCTFTTSPEFAIREPNGGF